MLRTFLIGNFSHVQRLCTAIRDSYVRAVDGTRRQIERLLVQHTSIQHSRVGKRIEHAFGHLAEIRSSTELLEEDVGQVPAMRKLEDLR